MNFENEKRKSPPAGERHALLLGIGFDGDGQKRVTVGKNFLLAGGSAPTHARMQEKAIRFNEELDRRRKRLEDIEPAEFHDIADQIRMHDEP
jgi:hypothetical protein